MIKSLKIFLHNIGIHRKTSGFETLIRLVISFAIHLKWHADKRTLALTDEYKFQYFNIHVHYFIARFRFPNIVRPITYNDKIQWLKLFDQSELHIICTDKLRVRGFVAECIGGQYLNPIYAHRKKFDELPFGDFPTSVVIKTNHDSGSVFLIKELNNYNTNEIHKSINTSLGFEYGIKMGEWQHAYIQPQVFAEKYMDSGSDYPPADFKFHCVKGKVIFIQYIFDRNAHTKEVILDTDWNQLKFKLGVNFEHSTKPVPKPINFNKMIEISEKLSSAFSYVRVDLYNLKGEIVFGEMTFFPHSGCYPEKQSTEVGKLIQIDTSEPRKPFKNQKTGDRPRFNT